MTDPEFRIVYVVSKWNQETETFVRREVAAGLRDGARIQVVSLRTPGASDGIVDDRDLRIIVPQFRHVLLGIVTAAWRAPVATVSSLLRIIRLGRPGTWLHHLRAWVAALAVAWRLDPADIVLAHFAWVSSTTADAIHRLRDTPMGIFVHAHGIYEHRSQDRYLTDRLTRAVAVFVESESIAADVVNGHGVEPVVMRMGVPRALLADRPSTPRRADPRLVVSVGALREKKGHDRLIRAIARFDDVMLTIAGEGPQRRDLEALIADLGVEDRVSLVGHQDQESVLALLDRASLFCLASRLTSSGDRDGVPNVLIEAMARGTPVVATAVSGIPDLLRDGCGLLVDPEDQDALSAGLEQVLRDPEFGLSIAQQAHDTVETSYTAERNWARLRDELVRAIRPEPAAR